MSAKMAILPRWFLSLPPATVMLALTAMGLADVTAPPQGDAPTADLGRQQRTSQLPDEAPQGLTARQLIEQHSSVAACAKCHAKIDPYGFALEQYDAIGRLRPNAVDTRTKLIDGKTIEGINELRDYLVKDCRDDIVSQFCRKLLGYSLGREVQLSDAPLLAEIQRKLEANGHRFSVAVESIVTSRQFREIRGRGMMYND